MTALLQYLEFRNFGLLKMATPFICSKGRFVSQGVSIVAKKEGKSGRGWGDEWVEDPASLCRQRVLELVMHLIAKSHIALREQSL